MYPNTGPPQDLPNYQQKNKLMPLFQNSVLNKYLKALDHKTIDESYAKFTAYFHNSERQKNIRTSKEEQFQEGFLRELFVKILGYSLNPDPNFNLTTELKNEKGAKKTDGAVLKNGKALAVIELKGTGTKDLDKVNDQAFSYKNHHTECVYVVTSNFEKLRFFIHNAVEHLEFNLFTLTKKEFSVLWLCLQANNLLDNIPLKAKEESVLVEENITKNLYKDYAQFKMELWQNVCKNAPQKNQLLLFKKTQKLLDRFLFIFFAEDSGLLPPNSIPRMVDRFDQLIELDAYKPLYEIFKQYFSYINIGRKGKTPQDDIFSYNGGLFKPDEEIDNFIIDDDLLKKHVLKLTAYDFESDVDVNILGHIFENSLNDIENVRAMLEGKEIDKSKSRRKKDGVFYTPKYITKYIVDNTIGKLCEEKKAKLGIIDEEYTKDRRNRKKETLKKLDASLQNYRKWLLNITICDPACGSGAFLNQALEFLINEHAYIDELNAQLLNVSIVFQDVSNHILERNVYGVDINDESVEIAKLSLWLRTAQRGRKLTSLNNNIKCGDSLIDDPDFAGEKAFNWQKEFPKVFAEGGFDVVIGNPPYVDIKGLDNKLVNILFNSYSTTENRINLYSIFIEKGHELIKKMGFLSFINPNSILMNSSYTKIRKMLLDDMTTIVKLPDHVFEDAIVETIIFEFRKKISSPTVNTIVYRKSEKINFVDNLLANSVAKSDWKENIGWTFNIFINPMQSSVLKKASSNSLDLVDIADFSLGITPYDKYKGHSAELIKSKQFHSYTKESKCYKPLISGTNIQRYHVSDDITEFIKYGDWLGAQREERFFTSPRVLIRQIVSGDPPRIYAGFTEKPLYYTQIGFGIIPKDNTISAKSLLAIVNSKLINFYHKFSFLDLEKELFQKILIANCKKFPIHKSILEKPKYFDQIIDQIIQIKESFLINNNLLTSLLKSKYNNISINKKLQKWHELEFSEFFNELEKARKKAAKDNGTEYLKLSLSEEAEWMQYFSEQKQKASELKQQIQQIDKQIDQMVYELYGLTKEEIEVVENS